MTKDEYIRVCSKYSEYLNLKGRGKCYIKGAIPMCEYQVTSVTYDGCITDSDKIIGMVWAKCYSPDKKTIQTKPKICYYAHTKEEFEKHIQMFIENYKKEKVKLKKYELENDFK